jgi:NAD(P)-dependent dehydrogenase (short-subunit alcohol dehydrogenase family)
MVNNAGVALEADNAMGIWEHDENVWDKTMAVNAKGVYLGCKYASAQMMKQEPHKCGDRGWIINLSSVYGWSGGPTIGTYCTLVRFSRY